MFRGVVLFILGSWICFSNGLMKMPDNATISDIALLYLTHPAQLLGAAMIGIGFLMVVIGYMQNKSF